MLSFVNKEVKALRKTGNPMNVDVAVSKLQECIDKSDSSETIKVLKQSRRVFNQEQFYLQVAEQAAERIDIRCVVPVLDIILKQLEVKPRVIAKGSSFLYYRVALFCSHGCMPYYIIIAAIYLLFLS